MSRKRHKSDSFIDFNCCNELKPDVTMSEKFRVPSHEELNLPPTSCRKPACLKSFKSDAARKKHEMDKHRYFENKGTTVCPISFYAESEPDLFVHPPSPPLQMHALKRRRTVSLSDVARFSIHPESQCSSSFSVSTQGHKQLDIDNTFMAGDNQCPFCLFEFQSSKTIRQHICPFKPPSSFSEATLLRRPKHWQKTLKILSQLRHAIQN